MRIRIRNKKVKTEKSIDKQEERVRNKNKSKKSQLGMTRQQVTNKKSINPFEFVRKIRGEVEVKKTKQKSNRTEIEKTKK